MNVHYFFSIHRSRHMNNCQCHEDNLFDSFLQLKFAIFQEESDFEKHPYKQKQHSRKQTDQFLECFFRCHTLYFARWNDNINKLVSKYLHRFYNILPFLFQNQNFCDNFRCTIFQKLAISFRSCWRSQNRSWVATFQKLFHSFRDD